MQKKKGGGGDKCEKKYPMTCLFRLHTEASLNQILPISSSSHLSCSLNLSTKTTFTIYHLLFYHSSPDFSLLSLSLYHPSPAFLIPYGAPIILLPGALIILASKHHLRHTSYCPDSSSPLSSFPNIIINPPHSHHPSPAPLNT